jgi:hypothetical protein
METNAHNCFSVGALPLLINRTGDGGWMHVVPRGELPNKEAGIVQVLDEKALDAILANIASERTRLGDRWPGIYIGEEHFIYNSEQSSSAFGWAKEFEKRGDGIWARPELTDTGDVVVKNKRFKFTSFVVDPKKPGSIEQMGGNKVRILRLDTIGLTNYPNGRELLAPISNRQTESALTNFRQGTGAPAGKPTNINKGQMKTVCTRLGLSADASEDAVLAVVDKLLNRAEISPAELTTLKNRNSELDEKNKKLSADVVDADWQRLKNRFKPEEEAKVKEQLLANREGFLFIADRLPVIGKAAAGERQQVLLNRGEGKAPGAGAEGIEGGDDAELARKAESEVQQYRLQNRCDYQTARNMVRMQKPELFGVNRT